MKKIGFGGSCHWCTEAIFRLLIGVHTVEQGWISSDTENKAFSEAVIVNFEPTRISLQILIAVHLNSHSCTSEHHMRTKYRSAIYTINEEQQKQAKVILTGMQKEFDKPIITKILPLESFKLNEENYLDYYYKAPTKPFCRNIVSPKLKMLFKNFSGHIAPEHVRHLSTL